MIQYSVRRRFWYLSVNKPTLVLECLATDLPSRRGTASVSWYVSSAIPLRRLQLLLLVARDISPGWKPLRWIDQVLRVSRPSPSAREARTPQGPRAGLNHHAVVAQAAMIQPPENLVRHPPAGAGMKAGGASPLSRGSNFSARHDTVYRASEIRRPPGGRRASGCLRAVPVVEASRRHRL